jgi:histidinol-phosphatase
MAGPDWSASLRRASDAELSDWLAAAHEWADLADRLALDAFRRELRVDAKDDGSFVTEADEAIEEGIRVRIADRFPGHGILGEEFGSDAGDRSTRWYLDPIDGTHNFMRGVPLFGTLIAIERDGEVQAGLMSAPALGQRWWASRGGGAWTQGGGGSQRRRLRVSTREHLRETQILYRAVTDMRASRVADGFETLLSSVWRERGFGDFWGYTLIADGAAEAMMERDLRPWDLAAPWILVEEAGGRITDFDGERSFTRGEALATNAVLHDRVLDVLWRRAGGEVQPPAR